MKTTLNLSTLIFKAALVLTAVVFFASWAGCSDNMNVTDPLNSNHITGNLPNHVPDQTSPVLIWSHGELKVSVRDEGMAENQVTFEKPIAPPPLENISGYLITFNVSTDADKFINGYFPLARVTRDNESGEVQNIYEESIFNGTTTDPYHTEIRFSNVPFNVVTFYAALFQADLNSRLSPGNSVSLSLSDIKIYMLRE